MRFRHWKDLFHETSTYKKMKILHTGNIHDMLQDPDMSCIYVCMCGHMCMHTISQLLINKYHRGINHRILLTTVEKVI